VRAYIGCIDVCSIVCTVGSATSRGLPWGIYCTVAARLSSADDLPARRASAVPAARRRPARHGRGLDPTSWVSKNPTSWEVGTGSSPLAALGGAPSTLLAGGQPGREINSCAAKAKRQKHWRFPAHSGGAASGCCSARCRDGDRWDMGTFGCAQ
jgi:hypothetical protein